MANEEESPEEKHLRGSPKLPLVPELDPELLPGIEPPGTEENDLTPLDEEFLSALLESVDYREKPRREGESPGADFTLATPEEIQETFRSIWERLATELTLDLRADDALASMRDLVVYDIPDGTRSTLTVPPMMDVDLDAGMYCLAVIHTLKSLGARKAVVMTHTAYNRARGAEDTRRFLKMIAKAVEPIAQYARRHRVKLQLVGQSTGYELENLIARTVPEFDNAPFEADFLVDYAEELFLTEESRKALARIPEIDVCVRHTKLQVSGGWIPTRMLKSSYVYSQNGTLFSNWSSDEYVALAAVALLSKKLMSGEILAKTYFDVDDVKRRYQLRELNLFQKTARLREDPRKLFVVGSPIGLYQVYY
ncbi:MAG: hypothetical protein E6K13_06645 [Methanobacteriota archaeon]|nr:MAG: hypothetical protein E6K13_06645 [Euryarchaeota archaeon]